LILMTLCWCEIMCLLVNWKPSGWPADSDKGES
jgi:hypothetical protein